MDKKYFDVLLSSIYKSIVELGINGVMGHDSTSVNYFWN